MATDGTYLPEFQVAQLRKVFKKATHDAHATGFRADTIRAPSIPPLPRFPGLPGVWADPSTSHPGRETDFVFLRELPGVLMGRGCTTHIQAGLRIDRRHPMARRRIRTRRGRRHRPCRRWRRC